MSEDPQARAARTARAIRATGLACLGLAVAMVGAAYAAVPLYTLFCNFTGFDGTPIISDKAAESVIERRVTVRFDTNVAPGLQWSFAPEMREISTRVGETQTVFFRVRNDGPRPSTGVATYNVQPGQAGSVFVKLKCFCFDEQTLKAGETLEVPVVFYVDPSITKDHNLDSMSAITLSYTYFASKNGEPVAAVDASAKRKL
ncbi:MAG: cytochrome c oxidase assembly protein [Methylobacteriaceae bacterium]|nr:cytochrome c oxidase assembly protein [Methylobacteriaceae bacterium]